MLSPCPRSIRKARIGLFLETQPRSSEPSQAVGCPTKSLGGWKKTSLKWSNSLSLGAKTVRKVVETGKFEYYGSRLQTAAVLKLPAVGRSISALFDWSTVLDCHVWQQVDRRLKNAGLTAL